MFKIVENTDKGAFVINMGDMKPGDIGVVVAGAKGHIGEVVMRTFSESHFEVMCLSDPKPNRCWVCPNEVKVKLFEPGYQITLEMV